MEKQKKLILSNDTSSLFAFVLQKCREMNIEPINKGNYWLLPVTKDEKIEFHPAKKDTYQESDYIGQKGFYTSLRYPDYQNLKHLLFFVANKGLIEDENDKKKLQEEGIVLTSDWFLAAYLATVGVNSCVIFNFYSSHWLFNSLNQFQCNNINSIILTPEDFRVISRNNSRKDLEDSDLGRSFCVDYIREVYEVSSLFPIYFQTSNELNITSETTFEDFLKCFKKIRLDELQQVSLEDIYLNFYEQKQDEQIEWLYNQLQDKCFFNEDEDVFIFYEQKTGCWETKQLNQIANLMTNLSWKSIDTPKFKYDRVFTSMKTVGARLSRFNPKLFSEKEDRIGFQNGCYYLKSQKFQPHHPENCLLFRNAYHFQEVAGSFQTVCPTIYQWLVDRVQGEEIYLNILLAFMYSVVLEIQNPERFLLLSGASATGKTTFLHLLTSLLPENRWYAARADDLIRNFGLENLRGFGKYLLMTNDLGQKDISEKFVNLIRSLVSTGETQWVDQKYADHQKICFTGLYATSSNGNPFADYQKEGILNRRMLFVPFEKVIPPDSIQCFEQLFPHQEREKFVCLAVQQDRQSIRQFVQMASHHPLVRQMTLESYQTDNHSELLQSIISSYFDYDPTGEMPLGSVEDYHRHNQQEQPQSCFGIYLLEAKKWNIVAEKRLSFNQFRREFPSLLQSTFPQWNVTKKRKALYQKEQNSKKLKQKRIWILTNVRILETPKDHQEEFQDDCFPLEAYRSMNFWCEPS